MRRFSPVLALVVAATFGPQAAAQAPGTNVLQNVSPLPPEQPTAPETPPVPLTADAIQGPPNPATMYALARLSDTQMAQYLAAYRAHMAATWNTRMATMSALKMLDRAHKNADADAVRYYRVITDQLWRQIRTNDLGFDAALGSILPQHQLASYRDWREAWERGTRAEQRLQLSLVDNTALVR